MVECLPQILRLVAPRVVPRARSDRADRAHGGRREPPGVLGANPRRTRRDPPTTVGLEDRAGLVVTVAVGRRAMGRRAPQSRLHRANVTREVPRGNVPHDATTETSVTASSMIARRGQEHRAVHGRVAPAVMNDPVDDGRRVTRGAPRAPSDAGATSDATHVRAPLDEPRAALLARARHATGVRVN